MSSSPPAATDGRSVSRPPREGAAASSGLEGAVSCDQDGSSALKSPSGDKKGAIHRIQPAKLLNSKWTAVRPADREKHWLVTRILDSEQPASRWEWIIIEAVHSRRAVRIRWRDLQDASAWRRGWC
jgi:tryptophan-rich hypothetical protein